MFKKPTAKQKTAIRLLTDQGTTFIGYGGAAGGGKTYLGCYWLMQLGYYAPGTRYFIGRDSLKDTRDSVLETWRKLSREINFAQWKYKENKIHFDNGTVIDFLDLSYYPQKDPNYDRFGSKEYTAGWIEEAAPVNFKAFDILKTRIGRWLNEEYKIKSKLLCTFNPAKTWVDYTFYQPYKKDEQKEDTKFIPALYTDNEHLPKDYIKNLKSITDESTRQRLLFGNFDYDDDPSALVDFDSIVDIFTNDHVIKGRRYISADLAMQGRDRFVSGYWEGLCCTIDIDMKKSTGKEIENKLNEQRITRSVGNSQIVADSDGLGAYLSSYIKNIKTFHGGQPAKNKKAFSNIKSECAWKLAEYINNRKIKIICSPEQRENIIKEISICLKRDNTDADIQKKKLITKKQMKELLGHSPDYLDMLIMRMFFDVKTVGRYAG